jgi:hypothetical protein
MRTAQKIPLRVDPSLLSNYAQVATILGVPLQQYVESYLRILTDELEANPLEWIANEFFHTPYRSRKLAEAAAEKFEAYAIDENLTGNAEGTISTSVTEYAPGDWRVKVHYLSQHGWRLVASDLWEDEGEEWKED